MSAARQETPVAIERRIFVVGVPRSGTTLLQSLLAAHSQLTSFTESHFFDQHFTHLPWLKTPLLTKDPGPRVREFLAENDAPTPATAHGFERHRPFLLWQTSKAGRQFLQVLDHLALQRGQAGWLEKTPKHLRYLPFIERLEKHPPRTDFIHVVRDGLQAVASLHRASQHWQVPYDLEACVRRWNEDVAFSLSRREASRDHFVSYEQLTHRPEETLQQLSSDLDLPWEPEVLERFANHSDQLMTAAETWKKDHGQTIRPSATAHKVLTEEQIQKVSGALHHELYERLFAKPAPSATPATS